MKIAEYTIDEIKKIVSGVSGMYDLARVVDPSECRILELRGDGGISAGECCYGVWESSQRCINCSSATACKTGCHQVKEERFNEKIFHIQSNPIRLKLADGGIYDAVLELISIHNDEKGAGAEAVNDRIAENSDSKAIRYQAQYDSLTKALNRDSFYEKARMEMEENPDIPRVMITSDIREFRLVNSLFGEAKGNEVLYKTAEHLKKIADDCGGICGRLGGDRFALLLPDALFSEESLIDAAHVLSGTFSSGIYTLSLHFGIFRVADTSAPVSVMCDRANMALRTISDDVRCSAAYFDDTIMEKRLAEQQTISEFDDALRNGQIRMYLQPLTDKSGNAFGAEALARWKRPDGEIVLPSAFIDTLERAGLIHELDKYIWEQAVKQLSLWRGTDKEDLSISVNMSAKDLYCMDVYQVLTDLLDKYGVSRDKLRIEITESALIEDPENSYPVITKLQDAGFLIEIDDFGKGQSSLSLLKDIKADILKIDMGFLRETANKTRSKIILRSVISMANELGMHVISEGVETEAQLSTLTSMGCSGFQGFYFSRPVPVSEFESKY